MEKWEPLSHAPIVFEPAWRKETQSPLWLIIDANLPEHLRSSSIDIINLLQLCPLAVLLLY